MKVRRYIFLFISLLMVTCALQGKSDEPIIIDITQMEEGEIPLSRLVSKIEYIPLELTKECPMPQVFHLYVTPQYILAVGAPKPIYMFDRKDGHFIKEISKQGNGPDEYLWADPTYSFDYSRQILYVDCIVKWKGIDVLQNKVVEEIVKPQFRYEKENLYQGAIGNPIPFKDKYYIGFTNNTTGQIKEKVLFFDKEGLVLKSFPNTHFFERISSDTPSNPAPFYEYRKELYFLPGDNLLDTVFCVKNDMLYPHIVFDLGNKDSQVEYNTKKLEGETYIYEENSNKKKVLFVEETDRYIFFNLLTGGPFSSQSSNGYYDKKTKRSYRTPFKSKHEIGLIDDINGLLNFNIKGLTTKKCLVGWIDANKLVEDNEMKRIKPLTEESKKIVQQTKFDDNPIVVIATLK